MAWRDEILELAEIDADGRVAGPGKFEGEDVVTLIAYHAMLNGDESIMLEGEDFNAFPELRTLGYREGQRFAVTEDDNGFVYREELPGGYNAQTSR